MHRISRGGYSILDEIFFFLFFFPVVSSSVRLTLPSVSTRFLRFFVYFGWMQSFITLVLFSSSVMDIHITSGHQHRCGRWRINALNMKIRLTQSIDVQPARASNKNKWILSHFGLTIAEAIHECAELESARFIIKSRVRAARCAGAVYTDKNACTFSLLFISSWLHRFALYLDRFKFISSFWSSFWRVLLCYCINAIAILWSLGRSKLQRWKTTKLSQFCTNCTLACSNDCTH